MNASVIRGGASSRARTVRDWFAPLRRRFGHALRLPIGERGLRFPTPEAFEFAMSGRITLPVEKVSDLMQRAPAQLRADAAAIKDAERRLIVLLEAALREDASFDQELASTDAHLFSQDHQWRTILQTLQPLGPAFREFKEIAVAKYLQYLASRQDVVRIVYALKAQDGLESEMDLETTPNPAMRETVMFDRELLGGERPLMRLERLPRGEPVELPVPAAAPLELMLAHHPFTLHGGPTMTLVDEHGHRYVLRPGPNQIGRHSTSTIRLEGGFRAISRKHLVIEPVAPDRVRLTDLSSHGSYIKAARPAEAAAA